eukprot:TRINITY_DN11216_c0_g1_i1.p1 TRINITY_DN11216_c0_g1~~TRINITY_DN11216_c0_g1_i1.p1  ORF type:complete len:304 (-),score=37.95 TRINITY_DN11216_c0_g1_i1:133-1044(-)
MRSQYRNKQRVLTVATRGIIARYRHLMNDLNALLPHSRKDVKYDPAEEIWHLNETCEIKNSNNCIFFECKRKKDLFIWMSKTPNGPSIKFQAHNVHTMEELKFSGNCLKGSRPIVHFDKNFDNEPHFQLMKELLTHIFSTPYMHPRSKPFIDHIISFFILDGRIWFRNFQITKERIGTKSDQTLREIGPRFVLNPIKILSGGFGGTVIWENPEYISPNKIRQLYMETGKVQKKINKNRSDIARERRSEKYGLNVPQYDQINDIYKDPDEQERLEKQNVRQPAKKKRKLNKKNRTEHQENGEQQ